MSAKCFLKKANSLWWRFFLLVKLYSKNNQWLEWSEQSLSLLQYSASMLVDKVAEWKDRSRKGQKYATRAPPDDDYVRDYVRRGVHGLWLLRLLTNCTYIGSRRRRPCRSRSSSDGAKAKRQQSCQACSLYTTTSCVRLSLIYDAIEARRNAAFGTEKRDVIWALSLYVTTKHVMSLF